MYVLAFKQIDASSNQSLVPSSLGMTFCVDGDVDRIEVDVRWGRYERSDDHEIFRTRKNKESGAEERTKAKVWQRIPCGGKFVLSLTEGVIAPKAPDKTYAEVRVRAEDGAPVLYALERDVILELLEVPSGRWARVRHRDGKPGYIPIKSIWGL